MHLEASSVRLSPLAKLHLYLGFVQIRMVSFSNSGFIVQFWKIHHDLALSMLADLSPREILLGAYTSYRLIISIYRKTSLPAWLVSFNSVRYAYWYSYLTYVCLCVFFVVLKYTYMDLHWYFCCLPVFIHALCRFI